MSRAIFLPALLLLPLGGCVDRDPCAGHNGTCLGLRVLGSARVDQLQVQLDGAAQLDGLTPSAPGPAHNLPVTTAVYLPSVNGAVDVTVTGRLAGAAIGESRAQVKLKPSQHLLVTLILEALGDDLSMAQDLGGIDLASSDLASSDLATPDLATPDLASADQSTLTGDLGAGDLRQAGDLAGTGPRRVFVLPPRSPQLGTLLSLDDECSTTADGAGLGNHYLAVISYPGVSAHDHITLGQGRTIVVPSGRQVATDGTFFTITHLSGIDEQANGTAVTGCVYTTFNPNGDSDKTANGDCAGWTSLASTDSAYVGDVTTADINWCFSTVASCDTSSCRIYCIEQ